MNELELLLSEMRNADFVSRTENSSTWHWRSLELTITFDNHNKPIKITGTNIKKEDTI